MPVATIAWNGGDPSFTPAGPFQLEQNQTLTLELSTDFPDGSLIEQVTIRKGTSGGALLGTWNRSPVTIQDGGTDIYTIGSASLVIQDLEAVSLQSKYWFGAKVIANGTIYDVDPELINEPGQGGEGPPPGPGKKHAR